MIEWLTKDWLSITVPVVVFLSFFVVAIWARRTVYSYLNNLLSKTKWEEREIFLQAIRHPIFQWCIILGAYSAVQISALSSYGKALAGSIAGSAFVVSLIWTTISLAEKLLRIYLNKIKTPSLLPANLIINVLRITFVVSGVLILLDIWIISTTPLVLIITIALLVVILASRDEILNIFSGFELARSSLIKTGDYIKLESGEEGYVSDITLRNVQIKASGGRIVLVPNSKLAKTTITAYRKPLKKATQPFHFHTQLYIKELTGLKTKNLPELISILKDVPDSVVYYHTHSFIEEYHYLTPQPANEFALWVSDVIGNEILAEKLSNIDTFEFSSISGLRERIIAVVNEELSLRGEGRMAFEGREFHFIKSVSVVLPTQYIAHDLREFVEALRKVSMNSLYYHIFESRLRLQKGINDFSIWLQDSLNERELSDKIAALDPYNYTLEGVRSLIIQLIEGRIK
ncbi:MAG: mechanosensitive ion channel family protein [Nitrospirae bacterium]|nr:mechanosensitive ion channel family protein [Nitrospirota bacterium]